MVDLCALLQVCIKSAITQTQLNLKERICACPFYFRPLLFCTIWADGAHTLHHLVRNQIICIMASIVLMMSQWRDAFKGLRPKVQRQPAITLHQPAQSTIRRTVDVCVICFVIFATILGRCRIIWFTDHLLRSCELAPHELVTWSCT